MVARSVLDMISGRGDEATTLLLLALHTASRPSTSHSRVEGALPVLCAAHAADPAGASTLPTSLHVDVGADVCIAAARPDAPLIIEPCFSEMNLPQLNLLLALGHSLPGTRSILSYVPFMFHSPVRARISLSAPCSIHNPRYAPCSHPPNPVRLTLFAIPDAYLQGC